MSRRSVYRLCVLAVVPFFISCVGVKADIAIQRSGGGTIALAYRISRMVESMGKMDGNERWLPLPAGRPDLERTVARIDGLSLRSFSSKQDEQDVSVDAVLDFTNLQALVSFLDSTGRSALLETANGQQSLTLRIAEGGGALDADLERLVRTMFSGYALELNFSFPEIPTISFLDNKKAIVDAPPAVVARIVQNRASFTSAMPDILGIKNPVVLKISWKQ